MLKVYITKQFRKDYQRSISRGCDPDKLQELLNFLANEKDLPVKHKDHSLANSKDFNHVRECHIAPDWLLIYKICKKEKTLKLIRTGTHSDLF